MPKLVVFSKIILFLSFDPTHWIQLRKSQCPA